MHQQSAPDLEPMRSETFPYPDRFADGVSPLGPVCYFDVGQAADLPPVILIHALGLNMTLWEYVAPVLAEKTRVVGLDLPGCGHSARPRHPYSLALMSQAVLGLMDHLGIERAVLMGHSYGGLIATDITLRHPGRVAGLVLMNSAGFTHYPRSWHLAARLVFRPRVIAPLIQRAVAPLLGRIFSTKNERTERFMRQVLGRREQHEHYAWDFAYYACPMIGDMMTDLQDRAGELALPTLVIWGTEDALLPVKAVSRWFKRLPDARLLTIPDCGHMPNLEHPDVVNKAVLEFLGRRRERAEEPAAVAR